MISYKLSICNRFINYIRILNKIRTILIEKNNIKLYRYYFHYWNFNQYMYVKDITSIFRKKLF